MKPNRSPGTGRLAHTRSSLAGNQSAPSSATIDATATDWRPHFAWANDRQIGASLSLRP